MSDYQTAIQQIEAILHHLRQNQAQDCAIAEQQDLLATRLNHLRYTLKPHDKHIFQSIQQLYQHKLLR